MLRACAPNPCPFSFHPLKRRLGYDHRFNFLSQAKLLLLPKLMRESFPPLSIPRFVASESEYC